MLYYFLDGLEKKGPYSPEELKLRNITEETLVFSEGMPNWQPIKQIPELYVLLFDNKQATDGETNAIEVKEIYEEEKQIEREAQDVLPDKKIVIPNAVLLLFAIGLSVLCSYFIVQFQKSRDREKLNTEIDKLFKGKEEICDYESYGIEGELKKVKLESFLGIPTIMVENLILASQPSSHNENEESYSYKDNVKNWNFYRQLYEYYSCSSGGFTILTLSKKTNGFDLVRHRSKDMAFKVPESEHVAGTNYGYGLTTPGYSLPTYRGSVQQAYDGARDYLSKEKENNSYVSSSYGRIKAFDELNSSFFYIDNIAPTTYSSNSVNFKSWETLGKAYVFNKNWVVWYESNGKHFEILEVKNILYKVWGLYSLVGVIIILLGYYALKFRARIAFAK